MGNFASQPKQEVSTRVHGDHQLVRGGFKLPELTEDLAGLHEESEVKKLFSEAGGRANIHNARRAEIDLITTAGRSKDKSSIAMGAHPRTGEEGIWSIDYNGNYTLLLGV